MTAICEELLQAIAYSRSSVLEDAGVSPQAARLVAVIEVHQRRELARRFGADQALLAKLEWTELGALGLSIRLLLDDPPTDLPNRFIVEIEPLLDAADLETLPSHGPDQ